ncbi:MAG: ATP-binding protein [Actinomycetota bacterium]|nr:ATP-binding protein [Actinomycetota bacterium]MDH5223961.1 ATP-binding protein [Actinomycetota bacterium]MDH5313295.1 ATP-binding protein [Actinomycetota bacterium]
MPTPESFTIELAATPDTVGVARAQIDRLAGALSDQTMEDARLLVSELVTNSLRHASLSPDQTIGLSFTLLDRSLRVEVRDPGPGFSPAIRGTRSTDDAGWGLFLVARLANRWGVHHDGGNSVWFELDEATMEASSDEP